MSIVEYKTERGIPLELGREVTEFYSLNEEVSEGRCRQLKMENEAKQAPKLSMSKMMSVDDDPYNMAPGMDDFDYDGMDDMEPPELAKIGQPPPIPKLGEMKFESMDVDMEMEDFEDMEIPAPMPNLSRAESSDMGPLVMERKHTIGALSNVNEVEEDKESESKHYGPQSQYSGQEQPSCRGVTDVACFMRTSMPNQLAHTSSRSAGNGFELSTLKYNKVESKISNKEPFSMKDL